MVARSRAKFCLVSPAAVVSDLTPERRWRIVLARDRRYDGAFVYAVQSTGIYCRPSCPSRRPGREHVTFFPVPEAAEVAGFRPCRRCRPSAASPPDPGVPLVRTVCRLIDAHPDRPASLALLSARAGVTSHRLLRTFKRVLGISPRQYRDARRLDRFKTELRSRGRVSPALYERDLPRQSGEPRGGAGGGPAHRVPRRRAATQARRARRVGRRPAALPRRPRGAARSAVGRARHGVPAPRLGDAASHPLRWHPLLRRNRARHRQAVRRSCRGARLCDEPGGARDPLPPSRASRWRTRWLPLGDRAQTCTIGTGTGDHGDVTASSACCPRARQSLRSRHDALRVPGGRDVRGA